MITTIMVGIWFYTAVRWLFRKTDYMPVMTPFMVILTTLVTLTVVGVNSNGG